MTVNKICVKYRLYPSHAEETKLRESLEVCRGLYNSFLHWRKFSYEIEGKAPTEREQEKKIAEWKPAHPELSSVYAHLLQNVAIRVDLAYQSYFRRVKDYREREAAGLLKENGKCPGPPRPKGRGVYDSLTWKEYDSGCRVLDKAVRLSKIGDIKAIIHRPLPGAPKTMTVRRQAGKWFACIACEVEDNPLPVSEEEIGIDIGIEKFAAFSNGEFIDNPRFFRTEEKALAKAQRKFDRLKNQHRTKKRRKAKKVIARTHERIRNRRHNFHHQETRKIVNRYGKIAVEKLNIKNMSKSPDPKQEEETGKFLPNGHATKAGLNKSILDAGWYSFRVILSYKAESAGRKVIGVNPAYTSQDCSGCGYRSKKKLSERWHFCPKCGLSLDRDTNAAHNILQNAVGLHSVVGIPA